MTKRRIACLFLPLLALGACDRAAPQKTTGPSGRVLPGTVSDAMLDTDRLQAQAPLAPIDTASPGVGPPRTGTRAGDEGETAAPSAPTEATPAPAASPAAPASPAPAASPT